MLRTVPPAALLAGLLAGLLSGCSAATGPVSPTGSAACGAPVAELPVRMADDVPIVTVWIGDQPADLLLDTGASLSSLTPEAAKRLGFAQTTPVPGRVFGIGGGQASSQVMAPRIAFGNVVLSQYPLEVLVSGRSRLGPVPDGGLGSDILHRYEVDLDLPHDTVRLYTGGPCVGALPGWLPGYATVPFERPFTRGWDIAIPAELDGHPVSALLDSGSQTTVVGTPQAVADGVPASELANDLETRMFGIGPGQVAGKLHRFDTLRVAGQTLPQPETAVVAMPFATPQMVLGADYLATHKVWISYATGQVHISDRW